MHMGQQLQSLCEQLGYPGGRGFLQAPSEFGQAIGAIHTLNAAASAIDLQACFGVWEHGFHQHAPARFVPLVYLLEASSLAEARRIHRWVWSQGVVPWLMIVIPGSILICPGFDFAPEQEWDEIIQRISTPLSEQGLALSALGDFAAIKLKSSVRWRDFSRQASGAVDKHLLDALNALHKLVSGDAGNGSLDPHVTNFLVGRIFYTFLLIDRELIPLAWSPSIEQHTQADGGRKPLSIPLAEFWALQDRIDDVFNGGVFQIAADKRQSISQERLDLAISFIRSGASLEGGGQQAALFDIDLTALQVETLSAVYEEFLRNEAPDGVKKDGVVYTPSFLVDFVVNRLDDEMKLNTESKVLDPTAGSGVFLVAAFRRIVERTLASRNLQSLPMEELRSILQNSIFGIEKSSSAAAVTAFSLYLNLLEYCSEDELLAAVHHGRRPRVFPALLDKNILVRDFFSSTNHFPSIRFTAALGNPPWKPITDVSEYAGSIQRYAVDGDEAAEQIVWQLLQSYLMPGGMLAMVMPSKSFASPSAKTFATSLGQTFHVKAIVNLSHWRRHLFANAVQPAALLFVANAPVGHSSRTYFYAPMLWNQPFRPQAMWTLAVDRAEIFPLPSIFAFAEPENTFDAYMLRPLERAVKARLRHGVQSATSTTLAGLLKDLGLKTAGGSTENRTNLHKSELCSPKDFSAPQRFFAPHSHEKALSLERLSQCNPIHIPKFSGVRLIVPRSLSYAVLVDFPLAVNTSLNVIHWPDAGDASRTTQSKRRTILTRLGHFLMSDVARYQFALFGQLWQIDRTRIETRDLLRIATPPAAFFESGDDDMSDEAILAAMNASDIREPMYDYMDNRAQFENGMCPPAANSPTTIVPDEYLSVLGATLRENFGDLVRRCRSESLSGTGVQVRIEFSEQLPAANIDLNNSESFQYFESTHVSWTKGERHMLLSKPNGQLYFTMERAYADALRVTNLLLSTH
ncbi:type I restriction-modification system, M subunit [Burkholderia pseudomallei]|nr:type I restriction-modification system, M subunit [Burkholderia pseudomallei]CAJ3150429.1 type I restriction-modification system, M subunit [Burkholderia pseudomallei]CAJ3182571.1 type I restriction-modification system, M subunit [Burkholderia pseudomallei]CAJ3184672.1 type I restriction-modification system, M subunit [Burkholderia pseudomallei]CAJ3681182.1 type I restriction-modification system, M subunit [Burkholderia pseudomallei]